MEEKEKSLVEKKPKENVILVVIIVVIALIDQILKIWVHASGGDITIIPNVLQFKITQNTSGAYGVGSNSTLMYIITNVVILAIIFKFMTTQNQFIDTKLKVFLSFILAGGISNVIDRIIRGYVTEFIDFSQVVPLPILNMADIFVIVGWVCIAAVFASFTVKEWRNKK